MNISSISSQITDNIFEKLDTNQQGFLSQETLSSAFGSLNSGQAETDAEGLISAMDADQDGQITKSELSQGVENLLGGLTRSHKGPRMQGMSPSFPNRMAGKGDAFDGLTADKAAEIAATTEKERLSNVMTQISENFDEIDTDQDGVVSREEGKAFRTAQREENMSQMSQSLEVDAMANVAKLIEAYGFDFTAEETAVSTIA